MLPGTVHVYKLRQKRSAEYLKGYALQVLIEEGRILLKDRRIPFTSVVDGALVLTAHPLSDLELETDGDNGWAAWVTIEPEPDWWHRTPL